jgi:RNA polymerase sigma factor (sigma-70 family)
MTEPNQLMRQYVESGSESAFRELVARYTDFVFSIALRRVGGDAHMAQDVTQSVFIDFARKAPALPNQVLLGGWLHRHTCFVSSNWLRAERRRQLREQRTAEMNVPPDESIPIWEQLRPVLDEAINQLGSADRAAIVLRFFEQRDLRTVAAGLGTSEDTARKRVSRAVDRLRVVLTRRGVTLSAAGLTTLLGTHSVLAAPAGLAAHAAITALAGATVGQGAITTFIQLLGMTKVKTGAITLIAAIGLGTPFVLQHKAISYLHDENAALQQQLAQQAQSASSRQQEEQPSSDAPLAKDQFAELLRLRGEVAVLQRENRRLATLTTSPETPLAIQVQPEKPMPIAGTETPFGAIEAFLSASRQSDTNLIHGLLRWRANEDISEDLAAQIVPGMMRSFTKSFSDLSGIRVLAERDEPPDGKRLRLEFNLESGRTVVREVQLVREENEWRPLLDIRRSSKGNSITTIFLHLPSPELGPTNYSQF